jgi:O-antigen ligase
MSVDLQLGIAAAGALCFGTLALLNLPLAVVLWVPTVSLIALAVLDVGPNLAGITLVIAWVGALAAHGSKVAALVVQHRRILLSLGALILWTMLSMAWAEEPRLGTDVFFGWLVAGVIITIVSTTLVEARYIRLAVAAFIVGSVMSVSIGFFGDAVQADSDRIVGASGDPNFLAAGIVPAVVLAFGLGAASSRGWVRLAVAAAVALLTIGLITTGSRGGLVAAVVAAIAVLVLAKRRRAWVIAGLLLIIGVGGMYVSADPDAWERISDFSESSGRGELWTVAWQIWQDNPAVGVGLQGFVDHSADYARALGPLEFSEFLAEEPKFVHNTYLELLAETGIVGLVLFVILVVACIRSAWQAAVHFDRQGDLAMATLARSVIAAVIAMLAAAFFISGSADRRLWVLLALGPALAASAAAREAPVGFGRPAERVGAGRLIRRRRRRTARPPA